MDDSAATAIWGIIMGTAIPIIAIVAVFAFLVVRARYRSAERQRLYDTVRVALERGDPLPEELTKALGETSPPRNDLRSGVIWVAIGLGTIIFGVVMGLEDGDLIYPLIGLGFVPLLIGVALALMGRFGAKQD